MYERIKELCDINGVSVNKMESDLDIARGSVCKIDKSDPGIKKLDKIAKYLNSTIDYIFYGLKKSNDEKWGDDVTHLYAKIRNDTELSKALLKYFKMSDEKRKHVVELINLLSMEK